MRVGDLYAGLDSIVQNTAMDAVSYNTTSYDSPVSPYNTMVPNLAFNLSMLVIWCFLVLIHLGMYWLKQYWFSTMFFFAGSLEVIGYIGRVISHYNIYSFPPFLMQLVCLTIAPVFTMAAIYYQLAKLIEIYGHRFALLSSPRAYSYIFIACDVLSLVIQAAGGAQSGSGSTSISAIEAGKNVFVAGLAIQVATMIVFMGLMLHLFYKLFVQTRLDHVRTSKLSWALFKIPQSEIDYLYRKKYEHIRQFPDRWVFHHFPLAMTCAVCFVFIRCCYRLAELVDGWNEYIMVHENYFIVLDALMMALATAILTVFHPGLAFKGRLENIKIMKGRVDPELVLAESITEPSSNSKENDSTFELPPPCENIYGKEEPFKTG